MCVVALFYVIILSVIVIVRVDALGLYVYSCAVVWLLLYFACSFIYIYIYILSCTLCVVGACYILWVFPHP